jgi:hypothetical protein
MASEIILIAKVAEQACATAVNDPSNLDARADLLNAVDAFVDAAGQKAGAKTLSRYPIFTSPGRRFGKHSALPDCRFQK